MIKIEESLSNAKPIRRELFFQNLLRFLQSNHDCILLSFHSAFLLNNDILLSVFRVWKEMLSEFMYVDRRALRPSKDIFSNEIFPDFFFAEWQLENH